MSDEKIAQDIGSYLMLLDEIHGSNGTENLKGERKAQFLSKIFGEKQFSYMGDSEADLAVWKHAKRAINVSAPKSLNTRAAQVADEIEHLETHTPTIGAYLKAMRPHQWMKTALVFLPTLVAHKIEGSSCFLTSYWPSSPLV